MTETKIWEEEYRLLLSLPGVAVSSRFQGIESGFERLRVDFPPLLGGIDWERAEPYCCSAPYPEESDEATVIRLLGVFAEMTAHVESNTFLFLSDGFFEHVFEFPASAAERILTVIVPLPHGIYIASPDFFWCLEVRMAGTTHLGRSRRCKP